MIREPAYFEDDDRKICIKDDHFVEIEKKEGNKIFRLHLSEDGLTDEDLIEMLVAYYIRYIDPHNGKTRLKWFLRAGRKEYLKYRAQYEKKLEKLNK